MEEVLAISDRALAACRITYLERRAWLTGGNVAPWKLGSTSRLNI